MEKTDIKSLDYDELKDFFVSIGEKPFRAKQVYQWIHEKQADGFEEMTNLSMDLRKQLGEEYEILPIWKCFLFIVGGIIAIKFGGDMVVDSASTIAKNFGMTDTLIGLTIVAFGTSLPELVTSIVAARKDEVDMALGNVIGSNIFNILLILGVSAFIHPIPVITESLYDTVILIGLSIIIYIFAATGDKIERKEGIAMIGAYILYMIYAVSRGMGWI